MSAPRDLDRMIQSFLVDGPLELPEPSYDEVRDRMEQKRQRAFIGPWRTPNLNRYLKIGLAAAAVVVIAVAGYQFLGNSNTGDPGATETPEPTLTPASTPEPTTAGGLAEGPFILTTGEIGAPLGSGPGSVTVTIAAPGWHGDPGDGILTKNENGDPPDGAGMIVFGGDLYVYGDPCQWASTTPDTPATTVDELVAALGSQASRDASAPVDITLDGYAGKSITLHVPDDAVFSDCDQGRFGSWTVPIEGGPGTEPYRYHQGPGQIDEMWIVDVDGVVTVIDWSYWAQTPADDVAELRAIVESATFE